MDERSLNWFAWQLRSEGFSDREIGGVIRKIFDLEKSGLKNVEKNNFENSIPAFNPDLNYQFFEFAIQTGFDLKVRKKIGPWTVEFLIDGFLVVDIAGKSDFEKNLFLQSMGYKIIVIDSEKLSQPDRLKIWIEKHLSVLEAKS